MLRWDKLKQVRFADGVNVEKIPPRFTAYLEKIDFGENFHAEEIEYYAFSG